MKKNLIIYYTTVLVSILATGCVKEIDKFNSNNLTVTFNNLGPNYLTADKTVKGKDSLDFSYSGVCNQPITYVTLTKNDTEIGRDSIKTGDRKSFSSLIKKLVADTIPGNYVYKVVARDNQGIYLGSSNPIIVTVSADFTYYTNQRLYVPDTTAKTNKTYFNFASQTAYSYNDIVAGGNSNQIDVGMFFDPATGTTTAKVSIYNLKVSPLPAPISIYDVSAFTKNLTLLKVITTPTWVNINSGALIKAQCATAFKTTTSANNIAAGVTAGSIILFKTAAGKCGAMNITYISGASASKSTYANFDIKIAN